MGFSAVTLFLLAFASLAVLIKCYDFTKNAKISTRIVQTRYGRLQGLILPMDQHRYLKKVEIFLGVPYATPPVQSNRFSPTRTPSPWDGVRISDKLGPVCPQKLPDVSNETAALEKMPKGRLEYLKRLLPYLRNQSEDCLYLNIYAPTQGESCFGGVCGRIIVWKELWEMCITETEFLIHTSQRFRNNDAVWKRRWKLSFKCKEMWLKASVRCWSCFYFPWVEFYSSVATGWLGSITDYISELQQLQPFAVQQDFKQTFVISTKARVCNLIRNAINRVKNILLHICFNFRASQWSHLKRSNVFVLFSQQKWQATVKVFFCRQKYSTLQNHYFCTLLKTKDNLNVNSYQICHLLRIFYK